MHPVSAFGLLVRFRQFVRRCQALNLPLPTLVRGRKDGSVWTGGLRFGWRGYSEHRMLLVVGLCLHCTAPRHLHILPLLTRGIASQHSFRMTGFQPFPPLTAVPRWRVGWSGSPSFPSAPSAGVGPMTSPSAKSSPSPKLPENCGLCGDQLRPRTWPASASPDIPNAATVAAPSSEYGRQESILTRPITGRGSI